MDCRLVHNWFPFKQIRQMITDTPREIVKANFHQGGLRVKPLYTVSAGFMSALRDDVQKIIDDTEPSNVSDGNHVTRWTNPYGEAKQYSLYNISGRTDDTSSDHTMPNPQKKFVMDKGYDALRSMIGFLSKYSLMNMRLNKMGANSGLSPHEEHIVHRQGSRVCVRVRFHLPVFSQVSMALLDGDWMRMYEGKVYYFNNGCVHASKNPTGHARYHLVWDMMLSQVCEDAMFKGNLGFAPFTPCDDRVEWLGDIDVKGYQTYPCDITQKEAIDNFAYY